jgi:hypothetical protein
MQTKEYSPSIAMNRHDSYQLELKIKYPPSSQTRSTWWSRLFSLFIDSKAEYKSEIYFLLPPAAGIGSGDYQPEEFYSDIRSYTRLVAPSISLKDLLNEDKNRCWKFLDIFLKLSIIYPRHKKQLGVEIRLLSCMFRESVHQYLHQEDLKKKQIKILIKQCIAFLQKWRKYLDALHELNVVEALHKPTMSSLFYVDEEMSIQIEFLFVRLSERFHISEKSQARIMNFLQQEKRYRRTKNYQMRQQDLVNGDFLLRIGMLKKYVSSVLFLEKQKMKNTDWFQHIALALAAGMAMAWAVLAQFFMFFYMGLELQQTMNSTLISTFFVIAIFSYILKDRIKATMGPYLRKKVQKKTNIPDRKFQFLFPQAQIPIASLEERFQFLHADTVSEELKQAWSVLEEKELAVIVGGDILSFHRKTSIYHQKMKRNFKKYSGMSDVIRLHLGRWVRTFDEPVKHITTFNEQGKLQTIPASRIYVVYAALRIFEPEDGTEKSKTPFSLYKILLSQKGIVSVQDMDSRSKYNWDLFGEDQSEDDSEELDEQDVLYPQNQQQSQTKTVYE